jgi:hypothetical protein
MKYTVVKSAVYCDMKQTERQIQIELLGFGTVRIVKPREAPWEVQETLREISNSNDVYLWVPEDGRELGQTTKAGFTV